MTLSHSKKGCALKDVDGFVRKAGGAPANVAAAVAKLGTPSSVITQVGMDAFGEYIIETLKQVGVNTDKIFSHAGGKHRFGVRVAREGR